MVVNPRGYFLTHLSLTSLEKEKDLDQTIEVFFYNIFLTKSRRTRK